MWVKSIVQVYTAKTASRLFTRKENTFAPLRLPLSGCCRAIRAERMRCWRFRLFAAYRQRYISWLKLGHAGSGRTQAPQDCRRARRDMPPETPQNRPASWAKLFLSSVEGASSRIQQSERWRLFLDSTRPEPIRQGRGIRRLYRRRCKFVSSVSYTYGSLFQEENNCQHHLKILFREDGGGTFAGITMLSRNGRYARFRRL